MVDKTLTAKRVRWTRAGVVAFTAFGAIAGLWAYAVNLAVNGWSLYEVIAFPLFSLLFTWIVFSFGVSTLGFVSVVRSSVTSPTVQAAEEATGPANVVAVLVPVYNEQPDDVFARVAAMVRSLREQAKLGDQTNKHESNGAPEFHFYVLSDTTDPETWLAEELAWSRLNQQLASEDPTHPPAVFYRHRRENKARKSGNIADFCERWSAPYELMIVLDADSLLEPSTMTAMVQAMQADPKLGILQVPPTPIGRESFFARLQQFSAAAYGPVCCQGFDAFAGDQGNYWGHNAILRVKAFCDSCDLPRLPGEAPLGGEILSHDFVEAALLVRDGWKVRLANGIGGSYEECPTTLTDYAMRDQRWCQGNLQHSRLIFSEGFHAASRWHFFSGVLSYVASPIWLTWTAFTVAVWMMEPTTKTLTQTWIPSQLFLFLIAMSLLLIPKLYGVIAIVMAGRSRQFGGVIRLFLSAILETVVSILLAPLMAVLHSRFVVNTLRGAQVKWNSQNRSEQGVSITDALRDYGFHTTLGIVIAIAILSWATPLTVWFIPIVAGLVFAVPLAMMLGSRSIGHHLRRWGLLCIPQEISQPVVCRNYEQTLAEYQADQQSDDTSNFERLLVSESFLLLHNRVLSSSGSDASMSQADRDQILQVAACAVEDIPREQRRAILSDQALLKSLSVIAHRQRIPVAME
jgi:membrane glycosyltransferase